MRSTMLPPWLRAESHAHRQLNTLPRCMRPEGDGAKRPTTGMGAAVAGASAACVAMLHALISMRTSIARGAVGETLPWPASCRAARCACRTTGSIARSPPASPTPQTTETPAALRNCRGFRGKGGHDPQANGKGANRFRSTALCPLLADSISARAATQSRYTCDGAMKWYLLPERAMPRSVPDCRQIRNVPRCRPRA